MKINHPIINYNCLKCDSELENLDGRPESGFIGDRCEDCGTENYFFIEKIDWDRARKTSSSIFVEL